MIIMNVMNDKGGVAKSVTALLIAQALTTGGKKVLVIDNDPQGTLSIDHLGCPANAPGLDEVLKNPSFLKKYLRKSLFQLAVLPSGPDLKSVSGMVSNSEFAKETIKNIMLEIKSLSEYFDYVIIDNPPGTSGTVFHFAEYSDRLIIPTIPDHACYFALDRSLLATQEFQGKEMLVIPTLVKNRKLHREVLSLMNEMTLKKGNEHIVIACKSISDSATIPIVLVEKENLILSHFTSKVAKEVIAIVMEHFTELNTQQWWETVKNVKVKYNAHNRKKLEKYRFQKKNMANATMNEVDA